MICLFNVQRLESLELGQFQLFVLLDVSKEDEGRFAQTHLAKGSTRLMLLMHMSLENSDNSHL